MAIDEGYVLVQRTLFIFLAFGVQDVIGEAGTVYADIIIGEQHLQGFISQRFQRGVAFYGYGLNLVQYLFRAAFAVVRPQSRASLHRPIIEIGNRTNGVACPEMQILVYDR